jgi:hypothetical protein
MLNLENIINTLAEDLENLHLEDHQLLPPSSYIPLLWISIPNINKDNVWILQGASPLNPITVADFFSINIDTFGSIWDIKDLAAITLHDSIAAVPILDYIVVDDHTLICRFQPPSPGIYNVDIYLQDVHVLSTQLPPIDYWTPQLFSIFNDSN